MLAGEGIIDSYSGATPLAEAAAGHMSNLPSVAEMFIGTIPGSIGETSTLAILIGAAILLITGIASARIIISTFVGGIVMGLILNIFAVNAFMELPAYQHLLLGGFAFGAVFMATDPVSATQTPKGKIIYGFLIGFLAVLIRVINPAYPEGVMLAILLMNVFAPLIDHYVIEGNIKKRLKRAKVKA
jgi:Na+-transporting NADH:ubiquinone oxidoreductase subunit B